MNDYNEFDYNSPYEQGKFAKGIKFILKSGMTFIVVAVLAILFFRMFSMRDPKIIKEYIWDNSAITEYNKLANKEDFKIYKYSLGSYRYYDESQSKEVMGNVPEFNQDRANSKYHGTFRASNIFYTENTKKLQIALRYNNVAEKNLIEDYSLARLPDGESFVFTLTDKSGNVYKEYSFTKAEKSVYNYRMLVFEDIDLSAAEELTLNIYFINDVDFTKNAYISMVIYDGRQKPVSVKLSDISSPSLTEGVSSRPSYQAKDE